VVCPPKGPCGNALSLAALGGDVALLREMAAHSAIGDGVINMRGIYAQHAGVLSYGSATLPKVMPALHMAAHEGNADMARALLALGADIDRLDVNNATAEKRARLSNAEEVARLFAGVRTRASELVDAIRSQDDEQLRRLLADGVDPNAAMLQGPTPLVAAIDADNEEAVRLLLGAGADPNKVKDEKTPMHAAMARRNPGIVRLLLAAGADPNEYLDGEMPPFAEAVRADSPEIVQAFIEARVSLSARYRVREGSIHNMLSYAVLHNSKQSAVLLAAQGMNPDLLICNADEICGNVLTLAAASGDADLVGGLILEGKLALHSINMTGLIDPEMGLEGVVIRREDEVIKIVPVLSETRLRDGARLPDGGQLLTPLSAAKKAGHAKVIQTLLALGATDTGPESGYIRIAK